ncbi:MAG: hypothetical protein ABIQ02_02790, partial [Saprospiraceae bacterium]
MRNATAGMKTSLPISQPLWSGFIKDLCRSYGVIWIVVAMITFCSIQHTSAQGPYCISQNCTANDIQNPSYFLGNSTGIPIVSVVCIPGQPVNNVYLWLTFTVTATNRYDINVIGDVLIDGVYNHTFNVCLGDFGSGTYTVLLEQIIWPCGSEMVVSNNLFSWENNDDGNVPNTCNVCPSVPSKCHRYGDISISGPIVADFSIQSQCQFGQPFETFIFTNQTSGGATPYNNYSWDFGIGATAVPSTISGPNASGPFTVTYSSAGPRTITLTVTDHVGTVSTNTQTINVQATPIATVTSSGSTICAGGTSILNASLSGGTANTYQWQFNTAGTWTNVGSNQNTYQTPVLSVGTYTYRVVINQATSCPAVSPNSIVTAVALPTVNVTVDTICNGGTGLLTATVTGGAGTNSYQWQQLIGSTWTNVGTNPGYTTDVLTTVGTYTYRVILTQNSSGCFAISSNTTVTVVDDPTVSVTASDFIICDGESSTLTATVIGGTGIIIYQWQTISVGIWSNTGSNQNTYTTPALAVGTYTYRVMISQSSGCESVTDTVSTIQVNPIPNASIDAPTSNLCYFQFRTFKPVAPEVPGYYYHWDFGTGASLPPTTGYGPYNVKYSTTGTKTVQLIVFANAAGANCGDTTTISFLVVACPGNITGKVRDTLGVGIGSVNIKLFQDNNLDGLPDPNIPPTKSVNTVSSGVYSMVSIIPGQYVIV